MRGQWDVGELLAAGASLCDTLSRALSRSSPRVAGHSTAHALGSPMAACGLPRVAAVLLAAASQLNQLCRARCRRPRPTRSRRVYPVASRRRQRGAEPEPPTKPPIGVLRAEAPSGRPPAVAATTLAALGFAAVLRAASLTVCAACDSLSALGATSQQ